MKLPSNIKFGSDKLAKTFQKLEKTDPSLFKWINQAFENIEENAFCGIQIPKRLIPKEYKAKYALENLWKYDLPSAWRLLYSIEHSEIIIVSIVIEWMSHKEYERRFNY